MGEKITFSTRWPIDKLKDTVMLFQITISREPRQRDKHRATHWRTELPSDRQVEKQLLNKRKCTQNDQTCPQQQPAQTGIAQPAAPMCSCWNLQQRDHFIQHFMPLWNSLTFEELMGGFIREAVFCSNLERPSFQKGYPNRVTVEGGRSCWVGVLVFIIFLQLVVTNGCPTHHLLLLHSWRSWMAFVYGFCFFAHPELRR